MKRKIEALNEPNINTPVVILCGGKGTRIFEETESKPKPMVEIGPRPILWHIMKTYASYNYKNFILCLGYKGEKIKEYILNYQALNSDLKINLGNRGVEYLNGCDEDDWNIILSDTGLEAMTGARVKRIEKYVDSDDFMITYGDGVSDIDIEELIKFHKNHDKIGTVTGVNYIGRFGELAVAGNKVAKFSEKPRFSDENMISGGYFVFKKEFFKYLWQSDDCVLEKEPLEKLAADGELMVYKHKGFWQCLDTFRDKQLLNDLWNSGQADWKVWK